ncbi:MAG: LacI family DNA-binding transcriptional regulator, partial [Candidatus Limnocylindrales bacterium]
PEVESIRGSHVPVILVDAPAWPEHGSVGVDDETGARAAAEHLVALGHRELLVVGVEPPTAVAEFSPEGVTGRRLAGYRSVAADHGIELGRDRVVVGPATFEGGEQSLLRAWSDGLRPTGVLAMSDAAAAGVVQGGRHLGLKVPDDLSVVGFDDLPLSRFIDPPLTTVHQPVRLKGEEAARLLLLALSSPPGSPTGEHRILETRLVVRRSTAPPPEPARARG